MLITDVIIEGYVIFFLNFVYLLTFLFSVCMYRYVCIVSVCVPMCVWTCVCLAYRSQFFSLSHGLQGSTQVTGFVVDHEWLLSNISCLCDIFIINILNKKVFSSSK